MANNRIQVKKCQIVIFIGHGQGSTPKYAFNFASPTCSAGAYVGCWPSLVNSKIPEVNRLPGAPMHAQSMLSVNPEDVQKFDPNDGNQFGYSKRNQDYYRQVADVVERPETDAVGVTAALYESAINQARALCQRGCCKRIEIVVYNHDAPIDYLPSTFRVLYTCK
jgi:hypothetical protein